jgi:hypothetical protein
MLGALAGCATISESNEQMLTVRTIADNREVSGVGCVLSNDAGRWFVTAPGRVLVRKSAGSLWIDCRKAGAVFGQDRVESKANSSVIIGNAVLTLGAGYLLDKRTGAGFDYPDTLTVLMQRSSARHAEESDEHAGNSVH